MTSQSPYETTNFISKGATKFKINGVEFMMLCIQAKDSNNIEAMDNVFVTDLNNYISGLGEYYIYKDCFYFETYNSAPEIMDVLEQLYESYDSENSDSDSTITLV